MQHISNIDSVSPSQCWPTIVVVWACGRNIPKTQITTKKRYYQRMSNKGQALILCINKMQHLNTHIGAVVVYCIYICT